MVSTRVIDLMLLSMLAYHIHGALCLCDPIEPFKNQEAVIIFSKFDVSERPYGDFSKKRHELTTVDLEKIGDYQSVLSDGTGSWNPPPLWLIEDIFCAGPEEALVAYRLDNLDMIGFTNRTGHWHAFDDVQHLLPGSTRLGFLSDYGSLIGGHMELVKVPLQRDSIENALGFLAGYDPKSTHEEDIKMALVKLRIVTSEAQRFTRINMQVNLGWLSEGSFMSKEDARDVLKWTEISEAILAWKKTSSWDDQHTRLLKTADIYSIEEAFSRVRLVRGRVAIEN